LSVNGFASEQLGGDGQSQDLLLVSTVACGLWCRRECHVLLGE